MTRVFHYLQFTCADEGWPRGSVATMKLPGGSFAELFAEPDECIETAITDWWIDHGQDLVRENIAAVDHTLETLKSLGDAA